MYKKSKSFIKSILYSVFIFTLFISVSSKCHAQLADNLGDDGNGFVPFQLNFSDLEHGVNKFWLFPKGNNPNSPEYSILDQAIYTGNGPEIIFHFDHYDVIQDNKYKLETTNTNTEYSKFFEVNKGNGKTFRVLSGSYIVLYEYDSAWNPFSGGDDKIELIVKFDGEKNRIVMSKDSKLTGTGSDNPDWDTETILTSLDILLNIEIPLILDNDYETKELTLNKKVKKVFTDSGNVFYVELNSDGTVSATDKNGLSENIEISSNANITNIKGDNTLIIRQQLYSSQKEYYVKGLEEIPTQPQTIVAKDQKEIIITIDGEEYYIGANADTKVKAEIKITKDGIIFNPGFDQLLINKDPDNIGIINSGTGTNTGQSSAIKNIGFTGEGLKKPTAGEFKGISTERNLESFIVGITNFILSFVAAIAILMLVYGGYLWITDRGDGDLVEKSKKIIAGSVIGILIVISAYTIVNTIIKLEGNSADLPQNDTNVGIGIGGLLGGAVGDLFDGDGDGTEGTIGGLLGGLIGGVGGNNNWWE